MGYCNSLLFVHPSREIRKIQIIKNSAALLVIKTIKYNHISPILRGLLWLPVHQRVMLKLICTTYENMYCTAPTYLNELLSIYALPRNLRSSSTGGVKLNQPIPCNKFYGEPAFSVSLEQFSSQFTFDRFL